MYIAVIGGGLAGVTTAYNLLDRGHSVALFDTNSSVGEECSFANGGQLSVCNSEVWNSPHNLLKGLGWLFRENAPIAIDWSFDWDRYVWLAQFIGNSFSAKENTRKIINLGWESRFALKRLLARTNIQFNHGKGIVKISDKPLSEFGGDLATQISPKKFFPSFKGTASYGVFYPSDGFGDAYKFLNNLFVWCRKNSCFRFRAKAEAYKVDGHRLHYYDGNHILSYTELFDKIVVCAGVGARQFGLPVHPVTGYSLTLWPENLNAMPQCSILDDAAKIVCSPLGDRLRVAGMAEIGNGQCSEMPQHRRLALDNWVKKNFPDAANGQAQEYVCHRPMTPSMVPIIKQSDDNPVLYYNTGFGHLGFTLCCGAAEKLMEVMFS